MSRTLRSVLAAAVVIASTLAFFGCPRGVRAETESYVHVVRPGETLASIAQRYYGDPRRESVLVAENGLSAQGGSAIVVGMRLVIPWVSHHVVREGETWNQIAEHYYGDSRRAVVLIDANEGSAGDQPDVGAALVVPYPLRHVAGQNENLRRIAVSYFRSEDVGIVRNLRRFNGMRGLRPARGQVVLIPLTDLVLSDEGRAIIEEATGERVEGGEIRAMQEHITEQLPTLSEHVRRGRYAEAVSLGNRLLGAGQLTGNQVVSIQRELGTAYVALDREDLAVEAFLTALRHQADLELDSTRTSPRVLRPFGEAQELAEAERAEEAEADAGPSADAGADEE